MRVTQHLLRFASISSLDLHVTAALKLKRNSVKLKPMKMKLHALCFLIVTGFCAYSQAEEQVTCSSKGPLCRDCRTLGYCSDRGNGELEFDTLKEEKCNEGFVCDEWTKQCTKNGTCRFKEFSCPVRKNIVVPSPYSCRGYYSCAEQTMNFCKQGEYYDWSMHECHPSENLKNCEGYQIICSKQGEIRKIGDFLYECVLDKNDTYNRVLYPKLVEERGNSLSLKFSCVAEGYFEDPENCSMFYKCMQSGSGFETQHLSCRRGSHFDPVEQACVIGECQTSTTSTTAITASTTSVTTTSSQAVSTIPPTSAPFVCESEGIFADPDDCSKYYRCEKMGDDFQMTHFTCRHGSHFDEAAQRCVAGECAGTTSTTAPLTTTYITTTTPTTPTVWCTAMPTTTTANPTTTSTPFSCVEEGIFEDPENCDMFYRCMKNGNSFTEQHLKCRDGSHFDPSTSRCVAGQC